MLDISLRGGTKCKKSNEVDEEKYFSRNVKNLTDYDYVVQKIGWRRNTRWILWYMHRYTRDYRTAYGPSLDCYFLKEEEDLQTYFTTIYTNNRYWMIQTLTNIYEGGFILKWNYWGTLAKNNHAKEFFVEPDKVPDSVNLNIFINCVCVFNIASCSKICTFS